MLPPKHHTLLAALVYLRFNCNHDDAIAAWKRMLQNDGWDDETGRREWRAQVQEGLVRLRAADLMPNLLDVIEPEKFYEDTERMIARIQERRKGGGGA